jgi:hypothetical protein
VEHPLSEVRVYVEPCPRIATVAGPNNFGRLYPEAIIFTTATSQEVKYRDYVCHFHHFESEVVALGVSIELALRSSIPSGSRSSKSRAR